MALKVARSTASRRLKKPASPAVFESAGGGGGGSKRRRMSSAFHILYPTYSGSLTLTPLGYGKPAPFLNVVLALGL